MRIRDPRTTALIFSSGKMVCTGAKRFLSPPGGGGGGGGGGDLYA